MVFPGVKSEDDRANVVAYLSTLAAEPAPLPAAIGIPGRDSAGLPPGGPA